ncbi:PSD3 [Symbiodinium sp. CCMP2456]|nr:PSD3 [Symbiodinium sp. CCMP2456]
MGSRAAHNWKRRPAVCKKLDLPSQALQSLLLRACSGRNCSRSCGLGICQKVCVGHSVRPAVSVLRYGKGKGKGQSKADRKTGLDGGRQRSRFSKGSCIGLFRWEACGRGQRRKWQAARLPPVRSTLWAGCPVLLIAPGGYVSRKTRRRAARLDWHKLATRTDEVLEAVSNHAPSSQEVEAVRSEIANVAELKVAAAELRKEVDARHAKVSWYEELFQATRLAKLTGAKVPDVDWTLIADRINKRFKYKPGKDAFCPAHYFTYEDWFLRALSPATLERCLSQAALAEVCSPVQGKAWEQVPSGEMSLKISVIAVSELLQVLDGKHLVQLRLRWPDYHRVHSPVDGKILAIDCYQKDELFPGAESLTVFSFSTPFGLVRLLCIGEWSVQSFVALGKIGDQVAKMDELGHFDLGSQVILSLPDGMDVCLEGSPKLFPGDPIAVVRSHSEKKAVPTLGRGRPTPCSTFGGQSCKPEADEVLDQKAPRSSVRGADPGTMRPVQDSLRVRPEKYKVENGMHQGEGRYVKKVKRLRKVRGEVATFVEPDACAASACCSSFVQKAEAEEHKTLSTSGTWYFSHSGTEESVTAIVPAETVLASTPAVVHGWCMKWKETASGTKPYLDQASSERTCARGTAYMLSEPGMTSKEPRGRKVLKKSLLKLKQTARVVCPGSLTERFIACGRASAYSALTAFERRLLSTGQLSRSLSTKSKSPEDADVLPLSARRLEADPKAYHQAAISAEGSLPARAVSRLWSVDAALETDALWPLCPERLQLAQRLQCQKGLRRRSDRYMREVLTPLIDQSVLSAAWTMAEPLPQLQHEKITCSGSQALCALSNYVISLSLGGLTGVKAAIPMLLVAIGSKLSDRFPLHLEDTWLDSWICIVVLGLLLILELVSDCIPALASCQDCAMLVAKPVLSFTMALAPSYGSQYGISSATGWLAAFSAGGLALVVAVIKAAWTLACDSCSGGCCSQVRSAVEHALTSILTLFVFFVGVIAAGVVVAGFAALIGYYVTARRREGKPMLPHEVATKSPDCCGDNADSGTDSESAEDDDELNAGWLESGSLGSGKAVGDRLLRGMDGSYEAGRGFGPLEASLAAASVLTVGWRSRIRKLPLSILRRRNSGACSCACARASALVWVRT